jgi:subtilisin family serine protease
MIRAGAVAAGISAMVILSAPAVSPARPAGDARFAPGELLVRFDRSADSADRTSALDAVDAETRRRLFVPGLRLVEIDRDAAVRDAAAVLERQAGVLYAEPNLVRRAVGIPNDPEFGLQWALRNSGQSIEGVVGTPGADIDAVNGWNRHVGSKSVVVGIADTGVKHDHADLAPNIWRNPGETVNGQDSDGNGFVDDVRGWDFWAHDNNPTLDPALLPASNHGTLVAGAAGARGNNGIGVTGSSRLVSLMPLRVGPADFFLDRAIMAYGYASQMGARVLNLSAGSGPGYSQAELDAIRAAQRTLFVFSAGNDSKNNDVAPFYPCNHDERNIVCVAASDQDDKLASFSNYGAGHVDLAAPGVRIRTTSASGGGYGYAGGTSLAAPIVSGVAAAYFARYPSAVPADARAALRAGVDKLPALNNRVEANGRLNMNRTLAIVPPDRTAPNTTITRAPKKKIKLRKKKRKKRVRFEFISSEPASSFQCKLDKAFSLKEKPFEPCASPYTKKVGRGKYFFDVRAIDRSGNADATPATHKWKVKRKKKRKKGRR